MGDDPVAVFLGVDIGQQREPTAICVAEAESREGTTHFLVRHLDRLPLGARYPDVAKRVGQITAALSRRAEGKPTVYVNATGVGVPVVELLREAAVGSVIVTVYFTHGDRRTGSGFREVTLGKAYLVSRLQALLQTGRVHLPRTPEAEALAEELQNYEIHVEEDANDRYGAFKVGAHDDLVTALGLAVQVDRRGIVITSLTWGSRSLRHDRLA